MHILLIRFSSIGDIILQTPVARWLKREFPNCKISFLTTSQFTDIPNILEVDNVFGMERFKGAKSAFQLLKYSRTLVKEHKFDLIIDLHSNTRSTLFKAFNLCTPSITIDKRKLERSLLAKLKINLLKNTPSIHKRNIQDLAFVFGRSSLIDSADDIFTDKSTPDKEKMIVISAVASFETKRWPVENFLKLIELIASSKRFNDYTIKVLGGPTDGYLLPLEKAQDLYPDRVKYLAGQTSLEETIELLKKCTVCIGNDTGLGHIAESYGARSIVIFGPTHPDFGFGVLKKYSKNIYTNEKCSPCSTLGSKACKLNEKICLTKILPSSVYEQLEKAMEIHL